MDKKINSQECKSFDAVTIKKSMNEYNHLINSKAYLLFEHGSLWGKMSMVNLVYM